MARDEAPKAMRVLFGSFWQNSKRGEAISLSVENLALGKERAVTPPMFRPQVATLADLTQAECVRAFSRAVMEVRFFPSLDTLREFNGRAVDRDPLACEAKAELLKLIEGMRGPRGPMLKPAVGPGVLCHGRRPPRRERHGRRNPDSG